MPSFEQIGRRLDRELQRLREVASNKVKPATRKKAARGVRRVATSLSRLAEDLEAKTGPKVP